MFADCERPEGPPILPRLLDGLSAAAGHRERSNSELELLALLEIVVNCLGQNTAVFIRSAELLALCQKSDELSWLGSTKALARFGSRFGLAPRESPDGKSRGYWFTREWLTEWQSGYQSSEDAT